MPFVGRLVAVSVMATQGKHSAYHAIGNTPTQEVHASLDPLLLWGVHRHSVFEPVCIQRKMIL